MLGWAQQRLDEEVEELKAYVTQKIEEKFPELEDGLAEKAVIYYSENSEMIEVTCGLNGYSGNGYGIGSYTVVFGEEFTQSKIEDDLEGKTDEEIGEIEDNMLNETGSDNYGAGSNPEGGPTVNIDTSNSSNFGGIYY